MIRRCNKIHRTKDLQKTTASPSRGFLDKRHRCGSRRCNLARSKDVTGDSRLMGRVRFLRAGLVTPLPGGLGIGSAGIMTGLRGASLDWDSGRRVTAAARTSQETRPGLSHGIDLRGKRRGGAPRGERVPLDALPRPKRSQMATSDCVARTVDGAPVGALPPSFVVGAGFKPAPTRRE